jgi:hypothetical protein
MREVRLWCFKMWCESRKLPGRCKWKVEPVNVQAAHYIGVRIGLIDLRAGKG